VAELVELMVEVAELVVGVSEDFLLFFHQKNNTIHPINNRNAPPIPHQAAIPRPGVIAAAAAVVAAAVAASVAAASAAAAAILSVLIFWTLVSIFEHAVVKGSYVEFTLHQEVRVSCHITSLVSHLGFY
jgi:hypothetical protein